MSFGQFLVDMAVILVWFAVVALWVFALIDVFRRQDLNGWLKAMWLRPSSSFPSSGPVSI